jgi:hypothetical protein
MRSLRRLGDVLVVGGDKKKLFQKKQEEIRLSCGCVSCSLFSVSVFAISIAFSPEAVSFCHQVKEFHSQRHLVFLSTISPRYTKFEQA